MRKDELLDLFEPVHVDKDTDAIPVRPGCVYIITDQELLMELWARRYCGPFYVEDWEFVTVPEPDEVHITIGHPRLNVNVETEGNYVAEEAWVDCDDGIRTLVTKVPFGADPVEEPVVLHGVLIAIDDRPVRVVTSGVSVRQQKILEASVTRELPEPKDLFEYASIFFDPVRAAGFTTNLRGHFMLIDDVGTGKSAFIRSFSVETMVGRGGTEAGITWNARDQAPGAVLRQPGGFIGWDEIDKCDVTEASKFIIDVLDQQVSRKVAGFQTTIPHYCRFMLAGNRIPSFPAGVLRALLSRLQYVGGASGEAREKIAFDLSMEAAEAIRDRVTEWTTAVHVAEFIEDDEEFFEVSNEVYREVMQRFREDLGKALAKAHQAVAQRFPPEQAAEEVVKMIQEAINAKGTLMEHVDIDNEFVKGAAWGHIHDKVRRFADTIAALGVEETAEMAREAYSLTELSPSLGDTEDDIAVITSAWIDSLRHNYGDHILDGDSPGPKVAYTPMWSPQDVELRWDEIDF